MTGDYRRRLVWDGVEHDETEYDLVLQNVMCEHDDVFMDGFMAWLRKRMFMEAWEMSLADLWYRFTSEYVDEHDEELIEMFEDEVKVIG